MVTFSLILKTILSKFSPPSQIYDVVILLFYLENPILTSMKDLLIENSNVND